MKVLICLLATCCACNATFLSLFGGNGGGSGGDSHASSYSSHDHGHYQSHGFGSSPQVIKVILNQGYSGSHAGSGGYSYGSSGYAHGGGSQIFKVISQNSAGPVDHGYSAGAAHHGSSYASGYRHSDSSSFYSQFNAILPHILQLILESDGGNGGYISSDHLNPQLIAHFGHQGKAIITRSNGKANSYYSGGQVVQKGHLEITRSEGAPVNSGPAHGPPAHPYSSHGPSAHGPPSHGHGW